MTTRVPLLAAFMALSMIAGCKVVSLGNGIFNCTADADCASGDKCLENICRTPASLDAGEPEGGDCAQMCTAEHEMCCGTTCANLASDNENCGTCERACDTSSHFNCVAGTCEPESSCDNGIDDNEDGLTDCQDTLACPSSTVCNNGGHCCNAQCAFENTATLCSDGVDNDCNGLTDCDDPGCLGQGCAAGSVCNSDQACVPGCFIDGSFQPPQAAHPGAPCLACDPSQNTADWSALPQGATSSGCSGDQACDGAGDCRRASGQPCAGDGDCASGACAGEICM